MTRQGMARHYALWLATALECIAKLEEHDQPAHARNLEGALAALADIFAIDVGKADLAAQMDEIGRLAWGDDWRAGCLPGVPEGDPA
jgi:hypothetical protein